MSKSVLIKTPFRRTFGDCADNPPILDIVRYGYFRGTARLYIRLMLGEHRRPYGAAGMIRLFGFTFAVWAWNLEESEPFFLQ
jgi:hypothetical protein